MKHNYLKFGITGLYWLFGTTMLFAQQLTNNQEIKLNDLSAFNTSGKTWSTSKSVTASLNNANDLKTINGTGILVNSITNKTKGSDLITNDQHGDIVLEFDYLMAKNAEAGIFLQGNYEIKLKDSWGVTRPLSSDNGAINERWSEFRPEGAKGYEGYAPRQNASKAPGLWQNMKITFQAPKFDSNGTKVSNARILGVELNGVLVQENVELFGTTKNASDKEKPFGPLRIQGNNGSFAIKNIKTSKLPETPTVENTRGRGAPDPIFIDAPVNNMIRSFVPFGQNKLAVHAISVGSPQNVHYSYDLDNGLLLKAWSGDFVDATPMWDGRGNGTTRARGAVTEFAKNQNPSIAKLSNNQMTWPADTAGSGYKPNGYILDIEDRPQFKYNIYGSEVTDVITVASNGKSITRNVTIDKPVENLYFLLANANNIEEVEKGLYLVDNQTYYLELPKDSQKPVIRENNGSKELIIPIQKQLNYSISF